MDLIPVYKKDAGTEEQSKGAHTPDTSGSSMKEMPGMQTSTAISTLNEFTVPVERQQQFGVTYATASIRPLYYTIRAASNLEADQSNLFEYTPRVDGYVRQLMINSPGQQVHEGETLMTVYSPDLFAAEQQLADLLTTRKNSSSIKPDPLINSSIRRLALWNVDQREIDSLLSGSKPS
jgi:multidrug efflux pump subunit AcrA (membrane-fusion protein)